MENQKKDFLPVIPLRGVAVLPGEIIHCDIGRKKSLAAMEYALSGDGLALFSAQQNAKQVEITSEDIFRVGTVCRIRQVFRIQNETVHLLVTGVSRAMIGEYVSDTPYFAANVVYPVETEPDAVTEEALRRRLSDAFRQHAASRDKLTVDQRENVLQTPEFSAFVDAISQHVATQLSDKQALLEEFDAEKRAMYLLALIAKELEVMAIDRRISEKIKGAMEQNQKEFVLREQLKAVKEELGVGEDDELSGYRARAAKKQLPDEVRTALEKQLNRYEQLPMGSHEQPMAQSYIECILDLPWVETSEENLDLAHARAVLDRDHYGMERVKERIIESLAVERLTNNPQGQILCLVGPPGVGKTSIAKAIAEATGRHFVRMSLGGVHDEAEIRGHRRTYIGAEPGRIIDSMKKAGTVNPLLLFDEIDKLSSDMRGDPASAMLEVLDSAQNNSFVDHFLELPYDLSRCMLLTTANDASLIPKPLLDRMEVIEVPSYLFDEKLEISRRHLIPRQMEKHGLKKTHLRIPEESLSTLVEGYTREAGVRELERVIAAVCRKTACEVVEGHRRLTLTPGRITEWLGPKKYYSDSEKHPPLVGVVTGLAWTSVGGETLEIEATAVPGKGNLQLTGQLGDVMQESARAAMTLVKANAEHFDIESEMFDKLDLHIHVPEGAVPKDGPSAGIAMATALVSALTGIPVRSDVAMTGEITLRGRVLPIGGLREKLLAAVRHGVTTVILPEENRESLFDVPARVKDALKILFVTDAETVLSHALTRCPKWSEAVLNVTEREDIHAAIRH